MDLLKLLCETPGVPGREERIRDLIIQQIQGIFDHIRQDAMGNLLATRKPRGPKDETKAGSRRILIAAHMDQIGFYVRHIDEKGFLRLQNVGGFDPRNLPAHRVLIQGREDLTGLLIPAGKPLHISSEEDRKKVPLISDFFVDTGLPVDQVRQLVRVGDPVTLVADFRLIGNLATGQALDNRAGVWTAIRAVSQTQSPHEITVAFTVQEEVGLRGASPATFGLDPDVALALDTTLACDVPGVPDDMAITSLGKGVAIKIMDGSAICDHRLVEEFLEVAHRHGIAHQLEILPMGGTDAGAMQRTRQGYRTGTLSLPTRYIHTVTEAVDRRDLEAACTLLARWLES